MSHVRPHQKHLPLRWVRVRRVQADDLARKVANGCVAVPDEVKDCRYFTHIFDPGRVGSHTKRAYHYGESSERASRKSV